MDATEALKQARQLYKAGRHNEAIAAANQILASDRDNADALNIVGMSALLSGREDEAVGLLTRVVQLKPHYVRAHINLAVTLLRLGRYPEAEEHARQAVRMVPDLAPTHLVLGRVLFTSGKFGESVESLERAVALDPADADAQFELGCACDHIGRTDAAAVHIRRAIELRPNFIDPYYTLAFLQCHQGLLDELIETYRAGRRAAPDDATFHSSLLFALTYHPDANAKQLFDEHRAWAEVHAEPLAREIAPHPNSRDPQRPLNIGYVSPHFVEHSVAFFMDPILERHDRNSVRVVIYSDVKKPDPVTKRLRNFGHTWRDTAALTDAQLAELVRRDEIDILVDLSQHLTGNRLLAFARKPAPVQISYLGYPGTTGLSTIDCRLGDPYLDPPDKSEEFSGETVLRLPESYFCYRPPDACPPIVEPPSLRGKSVTFVSHHGLLKLNARCIRVWAQILRKLPGSRLIVRAFVATLPFVRERYSKMFGESGVASDQIVFRKYGSLYQVMEELNEADIALDAIPFNGGTTTCHTLWMGVPVVSRCGALPVHRMGFSVLSQVGLADLVAHSDEEYVDIAVRLASDPARLRQLRQSMRRRMQDSPLMRAQPFVHGLEDAYRDAWRVWCEKTTEH